MNNNAQYQIHDNGGRPYLVTINGNKVSVGVRTRWDSATISGDYDHWRDYETLRVFIGDSPRCQMTEWSGGHGPKFLGNSVLLQMSADNTYIWIGNRGIISFKAKCPIVRFCSPVGNNDVAYPYAVDEATNCYLLLDGIISPYYGDVEPYRKYYDESKICEYNSTCGWENISQFYIGGERYDMRFNLRPEEEYDRSQRLGVSEHGSDTIEIGGIGFRRALLKPEYCELMRRFGRIKKYESFEMETLRERD